MKIYNNREWDEMEDGVVDRCRQWVLYCTEAHRPLVSVIWIAARDVKVE
jgi:hypothetical protein